MIHRSGMDASILHLEAPEVPMHVGSLQIADLPPGDASGNCEGVKPRRGRLPPAARRGRQPAASAARVS